MGMNQTALELHFEDHLANLQSKEIQKLFACVVLLVVVVVFLALCNCCRSSKATQKVVDENVQCSEETRPLKSAEFDLGGGILDSPTISHLRIDYSEDDSKRQLEADSSAEDVRAAALAAMESLEHHRQALEGGGAPQGKVASANPKPLDW